MYSDLLIKCITNAIYKDDVDNLRVRLKLNGVKFSKEARDTGSDWPSKAHSMVGTMRLNNLRDLTQKVIDEGIEGDFIETGVWRGGCCILMRGMLAFNQISDRKVYVADSFQGLPKPNVAAFCKDVGYDFSGYEELAVSIEDVKNNFMAYDYLDDSVVFVKGWFSDTLPKLQVGRLALIRLDGDLYESTIVGLEHLYPKLSVGGYVIVDDYGALPPCKAAVDFYREQQNLRAPLQQIDGAGVWWQKNEM
jgi:O-methyltransferase/8-demethyl-8-(2,3-dimethoxy-alpha-L-rhamnosyl)tetracenomycin-C 4'-O-methyltransferase